MDRHFLSGIDTVILRVSDIEKAKQWYKEKLGFSFVYEDANIRLAVLDTFGPTSLTLWQTQESIQVNARTASYPIFRSADARQAHQELKKRQVPVGELISDAASTYFTLQDLDGNIMEVCQVVS